LDIASDARGTFHLVWLDSRTGRQGLRYAQSNDAGQSWSANKSLADPTCECCWNRLVASRDGELAVLYRQHSPRDMALIRSHDNGVTWDLPETIGVFGWKFDGCPHVGGGLALTESNAAHAVVWTGREGDVGLYHLAGKQQSRLGDKNARASDLAASADGTLLATWESAGAIMAARSEDAGKTWLPARRLSAETSRAEMPRVVAVTDGFRVFWTELSLGQPARWASALVK
jgi:Neuraminidase (sialidase)